MGIEEAKKRINTAIEEKAETLDLSSLELSTKDLEILIPDIAKTNATELILINNVFENLPETIDQLQNLTKLVIKSDRFTALPEAIGSLINLRELSVWGDSFTSLPQSINALDNLTILKIIGSNFLALPDSIDELQNLKELAIIGDRFTALPRSIGKLTNLTALFIGGNNFVALPDTIDKLENLTKLIVGGNNFVALPDTIDKLENLTKLIVGGKKFKALPESIGRLTNLKYLDLEGTAITEMPETLGLIQGIVEIKLTNCPLSEETIIWLNYTFSGRVIYNMAAYSNNQSAEEVLQLLYTDPNERSSVIQNIENCDLDHGSIIYGGFRTQEKTTQEIIEEFLGNVQIHSQYDWEFYGPPIKSTLDSILDKEHFSKAERANNLAIMTTRMGDCPTPIREGLAQEAVKQLLIQKGKLSEINQARIEREALRDTINKLKGYRPNEKIEQSYGLINSIYLNHAEENPKNPNLRIMGHRTRLDSITPYPDFAFQQIQDNPALIHEFVGMVCQTTANNQPVLDNGAYCLDINKIKKIKDQYIAQFGFETEQQNEIKKHLQMYSNEMTGFIKEKKELVNNYFQEAEHLLDIISHKEKLQKLLTTGDIKQEYDQFLIQKKSEILMFLKEKKNPKPPLSKFTVPINEKAPPRPKSPNRSNKKQIDETLLTPKR